MLREHRFHVFASFGYFVVLEALLVGAILFWPSFAENIDPLKSMAKLEFLRDALDKMEKGGVAAYVHGQHFFKGCNTVGSLASVLFAFGAVAGEAHRGTLELWLSRPLSRRRILLERWTAGALALVVPIFATTATIPWLLGFVDEDMQYGPLMLSALHQSLLMLAVYSATFLYSTLSSRPIQIAFAMLLFMIAQFAMYMIMSVTHWSIFRMSDLDVYARIGATRALDWSIAGPLVAFSAVCVGLSLVAFARRVP
jgi:ABC-type transport system involved in multi-copper enzyme maturation permease subunit